MTTCSLSQSMEHLQSRDWFHYAGGCRVGIWEEWAGEDVCLSALMEMSLDTAEMEGRIEQIGFYFGDE